MFLSKQNLCSLVQVITLVVAEVVGLAGREEAVGLLEDVGEDNLHLPINYQ